MTVTTLGMDLAKGILQLRGGEGRGKVAVQKRVTHDKLLATVAQLPPCVMSWKPVRVPRIGCGSFRN
jgi:transposase